MKTSSSPLSIVLLTAFAVTVSSVPGGPAPLGATAAASSADNDAGTGTDASNAASAPTRLPAWGSYAGASRSNDDADWYAHADPALSTQPACVRSAASGNTYSNVTLRTTSGAVVHGITTGMPQDGTTTELVIAVPRLTDAAFGIVPVPNPMDKTPARPGDYAFTLRGQSRADLGSSETGLGGDAGGMLSNAAPVNGPCVAGTLDPLNGMGDTRDLFSFEGGAGEQIVYSLGADASVPITLAILDANRAQVGDAIANGGIGTVALPANGTYYLSVASMSGTSKLPYVAGLMLDGPDPPPGSGCRPTCIVT